MCGCVCALVRACVLVRHNKQYTRHTHVMSFSPPTHTPTLTNCQGLRGGGGRLHEKKEARENMAFPRKKRFLLEESARGGDRKRKRRFCSRKKAFLGGGKSFFCLPHFPLRWGKTAFFRGYLKAFLLLFFSPPPPQFLNAHTHTHGFVEKEIKLNVVVWLTALKKCEWCCAAEEGIVHTTLIQFAEIPKKTC